MSSQTTAAMPVERSHPAHAPKSKPSPRLQAARTFISLMKDGKFPKPLRLGVRAGGWRLGWKSTSGSPDRLKERA